MHDPTSAVYIQTNEFERTVKYIMTVYIGHADLNLILNWKNEY